MDYLYVVLTGVIAVILLLQVVLREKIEVMNEKFRIKSTGVTNVLLITFIVLLIIMVVRQIYAIVYSEFSLNDGIQLAFWIILITSQLLNLTRVYVISEEGMYSMTLGNRVIRKFTWEEIPGAIEGKNGKIKFNVKNGKSLYTLTARLGDDKSEVLAYLKKKMTIDTE